MPTLLSNKTLQNKRLKVFITKLQSKRISFVILTTKAEKSLQLIALNALKLLISSLFWLNDCIHWKTVPNGDQHNSPPEEQLRSRVINFKIHLSQTSLEWTAITTPHPIKRDESSSKQSQVILADRATLPRPRAVRPYYHSLIAQQNTCELRFFREECDHIKGNVGIEEADS